MNLQEALDRTHARLKHAHIPDARLDAEYLVAEAARIPRLRLALSKKRSLTPTAEQQLGLWVQERLERRPLAYVLGEQPFFHLNMRVTPDVLVPRPETELLVEEAYRFLDTQAGAVAVDIGTGSGNIAISLARHPHVSEVHAVDISSAALAIARENALRNGATRAIHWHCGDLLNPILKEQIRADVIVANLPYIRTEELESLSPEVRWEPALALDGGQDGLAYIYQLIDQAEQGLQPGGALLLEIGADQGPAVLQKLAQRPNWTGSRLQCDLAGLPRIIYAERGAHVGSSDH